MAPATVQTTMAPLKALLATAVEDRQIRYNPAAGVKLAQPSDATEDREEELKVLTDEELAALLAVTPDQWRLFFEFLFETGLRIGEAFELRWGDIRGDFVRVDRQFLRGKVSKPKGRKTRRVRLSQPMAQTLWVRRSSLRPADGDLVFGSAQGTRIHRNNVANRMSKPAAVRAGIGDWVHFHTFRHTCATALFRLGWNAKQVATFLGHADPGFTLRTYVHLLAEDRPQPDFRRQWGNGWGNTSHRNSPRRGSGPCGCIPVFPVVAGETVRHASVSH